MGDEEHKIYHRRLIYILVIIAILLFGGAAIYRYIEGWRYLDALYFSAYSITTVGYGDITPKTDMGKIFTIIYLFSGVGLGLYGLSILATHFVEVREEFWAQRFGYVRIKHHTKSFFSRMKNIFFFNSKEISDKYKNEAGKEK